MKPAKQAQQAKLHYQVYSLDPKAEEELAVFLDAFIEAGAWRLYSGRYVDKDYRPVEVKAELPKDVRLTGRVLANVKMADAVVADPPQSPRLRVRRVDHESLEGVKPDFQDRGWSVWCEDGGDVANAYGYHAETETVVVIRDPKGQTRVWYGRSRANNTTEVAAALGALGYHTDAHELWDNRIKSKERRRAAWRALKGLHRDALKDEKRQARINVRRKVT